MSAGGTLPLLSMDPQKIDMEWSNLPSGGLQGDESWENDYSVALKYADKNRYSDVLPFNESRVSLEPSESNPDGYINANVIELPSSQAIATQGPLPQTFSEFWQMIWEKDVRILVMLTKLLERRQVKAHCYWPTEESGVQCFDNVSITPLDTEQHAQFVVRKFVISRAESQREIYQVQYTDWPDFGVPSSSHSILKLLSVIESHKRLLCSSSSCETNILVHCSAGIGRCGTLLSIFSALESYLLGTAKEELSIPEIVASLRRQRAGMVQTKDQYAFIYQVVNDYIAARESGVPYQEYMEEELVCTGNKAGKESSLKKRDLRSSKPRKALRQIRHVSDGSITKRSSRGDLHQTKTNWNAPCSGSKGDECV